METFSQLNILIVDDDLNLCKTLSESFAEEKFLPKYVLDGTEALKIL